MADDVDFESKTEPASPRRREEAYEKGQFAFSAELNTGFVLLFGIGGLAFVAHTLGGGLLSQTRSDLRSSAPPELGPEIVQQLLSSLFSRAMALSAALMGALVVGAMVANFAQVGFRINPARITLDWERVSPLNFSRFLSWGKSVKGLIMLLKLSAVAAVAWWILRQRGPEVLHVGDVGLLDAVSRSWSIILRLSLGLAGTLFVIGVLDYAWQLWTFERSIRMSKQELKEELKREEGDPQIKARIRRMQRETAQRKMFQRVPTATVIVTNPTHLAIAIQYEPGMAAPKVIAKGAGFIAQRIIQLARAHGVPVVERKPLAQALYKKVKIDKEIPFALYFVVAELLAYVYQLKRQN